MERGWDLPEDGLGCKGDRFKGEFQYMVLQALQKPFVASGEA